MLALVGRWMLVGLICFGTLTGLIRSQPYQPLVTDGLPGAEPGCDSPCFMGIQVGRTTAAEALRILNAHPWVETAERPLDQFIVWGWTGNQPAYIDATAPGSLMVNADRVIAISLLTRLRTGDWILQWEPPAVMESGSALQDGKLVLFYSIGFLEPSMYIGGAIAPCLTVDHLWQQRVGMEIRPVYPPWNDQTQSETLDSFMGRFHLLRERNCRP
jgi:hypothetical protein